MSEEKGTVKSYDACSDPKGHRDHMCQLMEKGLSAEISRLTTHPAFTCRNCGARANDREDLCNPQPLQGS